MLRDDADHYLIAPAPERAGLTRAVEGVDETGEAAVLSVVEERPLTIFLNGQEIVTAMTIGDYPEYLALGFLRNQGMLADSETVTGVDYDDDLETVVVRTDGETTYDEKLTKKTRTSGCAVGLRNKLKHLFSHARERLIQTRRNEVRLVRFLKDSIVLALATSAGSVFTCWMTRFERRKRKTCLRPACLV